ncbi:hypothetical protein M433DRAFT_160344 [Acidomyces richmondensis BFW]|nr:MAG: hypothetical protein FE78DRAFT_90853 [Acidomyces sp. 'richmondensis']KYG40492.1 hypothetical protein M433DRAFT_160344 [Acidomyces richmondensis BFW]
MSNSGMYRTPTPSEAGGPIRPRLDDNSASKVAKLDFYYGDRYKLKGIFADFKQFSRVIESIFGIYNSKEVAIRII